MADPGTLFTDRRQAEIEKRLREIYSEAQKDMEKRLNEHLDFFKTAGAAMKEKVDNGQLSLAKYQKWEKEQVFIGKTWKDKINSVTAAIHNANVTASNIINGERRAVFGENATYQAYKLEHDAGMDLSFTVYDSGAVTRLLRDQPELLKRRKIDGREDKAWNRTLISDIIAKNIIVGSSIPKIAQEIAEKTTERNKAASVRYARTSMTAAQNAGRIAALHDAQDMGIKVKKVWKATLDSRTRDSHADIDGEVKEIDEEFSNGLQYPGDPDGQASEVWNCRCTLIYKYDDYPMQNAKRYDQQNHELIENMTYKEWKAYKQSSPMTSVINHVIAQGKDITATWARRADKFAFEIEDVMNAQGFDGLPRLVDPDEFDRMVKEANGGQGFIAQRTYSAPDQETLDAYREMLYNGKWYVDCSTGGAQYGQGMYCAADYTGKITKGMQSEMQHYQELSRYRANSQAVQIGRATYYKETNTDNKVYSYVETMTLTPDAKVITYNKLRQMYMDEQYTMLEKLTEEEYMRWQDNRISDLGSYAAAKGYDAINAEGHGKSGSYTVILNRTKCIIRRPTK